MKYWFDRSSHFRSSRPQLTALLGTWHRHVRGAISLHPGWQHPDHEGGNLPVLIYTWHLDYWLIDLRLCTRTKCMPGTREVRQLAALVASKVYYHLDSYVDSLVLLPWRQDPVQNDQHGHPPDCLFRKRKIIINITCSGKWISLLWYCVLSDCSNVICQGSFYKSKYVVVFKSAICQIKQCVQASVRPCKRCIQASVA